MDSFFDLFAVALFVATASIFFLRFRHEDPRLMPYIVISLSCALANWLGENGAALAAIAILAAGSFLLLHITSAPCSDEAIDDDIVH